LTLLQLSAPPRHLHSFPTRRSSDLVMAADSVSFGLRAGERLGVVGESGSGKSTLALAILRMIKPSSQISPASMRPGGVNLMTLRSEEHTSELQSRFDLVCRLLLEKK